jgi:PhzF family phenazine biosynthesis protein
MGIAIYKVDSFTDTPFKGNPAGVCLLPKPADTTWMLNIAKEMNLSETAFLVREIDGFNLRWFTPAVEVDLCGHATLASAHILWETGLLGLAETARFHTRSGLLTVTRQGDLMEMDFPAKTDEPVQTPAGLLEALGVSNPLYVGKNKFDYLVEISSEEAVRNLKPDFTRLAAIEVRGTMVTSKSSSPDYDFVSRFFGPAVGVPEDPVTGSAHCCLGPYWSRKLGKTEFRAFQASARGGFLRVRVQGDRVLLAGRAVTVLKGELMV